MLYLSKKFKYICFILSIIFIFFFAILANLSLLKGFFLLGFFLLAMFLFLKPFFGLLFLIVLRPAIDRIGTETFLQGTDFSLNYNGVLAVLVLIWGGAMLFMRRKDLKKMPAFLPISLFGILALLTLFWTPVFANGLREFLRISSIFIFYAVAFVLVQSKAQFRKLISAFIAASIVPLGASLWQFYKGEGEVIFGEYFRRIYGSFFYPNSLAFFLVFVIALLLLLAYQAKEKQSKILYGTLGIAFFFVLLKTYTRGAWMGALVVFLIFSLFRFRKLLLCGLIFLVLIYIFAPTLQLQERIGDIVRLEPFSSLMWRFRLWKNTMPFFFEKPILGHGLSSFQVLSRDIQGLSLLPAPEAHNDYLKILIETGAIGLIIYISVYLKLLVFNLGICLKSKEKYLKDISFLAVLLLATFLIMAFGDNILRGTATQWALFAYLGGVSSLTVGRKL